LYVIIRQQALVWPLVPELEDEEQDLPKALVRPPLRRGLSDSRVGPAPIDLSLACVVGVRVQSEARIQELRESTNWKTEKRNHLFARTCPLYNVTTAGSFM
jgi:hypothetical protein